ncbi:hypothetical protein Pcinc_022764 [Petrolisthes cinctipes]|uniref:Uncharacterized protein n=1 Tax=Petrolisthes cinctipes TaxID=88211 RepID=A0AAE1FEW2_PETCI|nr:hypothetical protein Pcinc_022764 [Petrolisthes cinctipes]
MVTFCVLDVQGQRFRERGRHNRHRNSGSIRGNAEAFFAGGVNAVRPGPGSLFTHPGRPAPPIYFGIPQRPWWQQYYRWH